MKTSLLRSFVLLALLFPGIIVFSQKFVPFTGDIKILKNEKALNVKFSYDKMKIGEFNTEKEYTDHRVQEYDEKKQGKGAEWLAEWIDNKKFWENNFIEELNKRLEANGVIVGLDKNEAKYTLQLNPLFLEIGYYAFMVEGKSELDLEILVCETNNLENQDARILIENAFGSHETDKKRIGRAYEAAAKKLGKFLVKNVY